MGKLRKGRELPQLPLLPLLLQPRGLRRRWRKSGISNPGLSLGSTTAGGEADGGGGDIGRLVDTTRAAGGGVA